MRGKLLRETIFKVLRSLHQIFHLPIPQNPPYCLSIPSLQPFNAIITTGILEGNYLTDTQFLARTQRLCISEDRLLFYVTAILLYKLYRVGGVKSVLLYKRRFFRLFHFFLMSLVSCKTSFVSTKIATLFFWTYMSADDFVDL